MKKTITLLLAFAAVVVFILPAFCQEDIKELKNPAFQKAERPAVPFMHDEHNEKAGLDGCLPCHHEGKENGELVEGDPVACADCHEAAPADGSMDLKTAYHKQCIQCHEDAAKGPVACGECHVK
ncbi:acidic tetraheme cytochrome c3 TmcA [Salidesulfovibrio onnuriiensis]|uniref:acidic tetraheme cytochrome c3 TmcA n=1 Tax=Salidesulfovibrio onnuriiensis TaxID=2583823 RepID=UPI0011CA9F37|nr:cytochrome c3 family protein [Salidesulfovibrio onnuriiensis]